MSGAKIRIAEMHTLEPLPQRFGRSSDPPPAGVAAPACENGAHRGVPVTGAFN